MAIGLLVSSLQHVYALVVFRIDLWLVSMVVSESSFISIVIFHLNILQAVVKSCLCIRLRRLLHPSEVTVTSTSDSE
jgi:hypothetical protein